jgi:hypothetical protein
VLLVRLDNAMAVIDSAAPFIPVNGGRYCLCCGLPFRGPDRRKVGRSSWSSNG